MPTHEQPDYVAATAVAIDDCLRLERLRPAVQGAIDAILSSPAFDLDRPIVLCGSGDSLSAALSAAPALRRWSGVGVRVLTPIELARYEVPVLDPKELVICISNSGGSTRVREAVTLSRQHGNRTIGLSGDARGALSQLAEWPLVRPVLPSERLSRQWGRVFLNMAEYLGSLYVLYNLGLELGVRRKRMDLARAEAWRREIEAALLHVPAAAAAIDEAVRSAAASLAGLANLWAVGAGPNRGTADYSAAKCHEQFPFNGIPQDLEEWSHNQYHLTPHWTHRSVVLVLAPPGNALDRAEEVVEGIAGAGGIALVAAHPRHGRFPKARWTFPIDFEASELLTPILYHLPAQLLVLRLANADGRYDLPLKRPDDFFLIRKGLIRSSADDLA